MARIVRVRRTPGGVDRLGNLITSTTSRTAFPDRSFVAPRESPEITDRGRFGVIVGLTLYFPLGFDLTYEDAVEVDGVLFEVDGEVGRWMSPFTGWAAGSTAALTRAVG